MSKFIKILALIAASTFAAQASAATTLAGAHNGRHAMKGHHGHMMKKKMMMKSAAPSGDAGVAGKQTPTGGNPGGAPNRS